MVLTVDFIKNTFEKMNAEYFQNSLKEPVFKIIKSRKHLGCLKYKNITRKKAVDFTLCVSEFYNRTEFEYQNTIIHEMIHLYIKQNNIKDTSSHGYKFMEIARRINNSGWKIGKNGYIEERKINQKYKKQFNLVTFIDSAGKYFLMKYNMKSRKKYMTNFVKYGFSGVVWFVSSDIEFLSLPENRTQFNGRYISKEKYDELTSIDVYKKAI